MNGKQYVGGSIHISARLSTHFGREFKNNDSHDLYKEMREFGKDVFKWEVLEECTQQELLNREQYWYDKLKPEYNFMKPCSNPLIDEKVKQKTRDNVSKVADQLKVKYKEEKYQKMFRENQRHRFKAVRNVELNIEFESLSEAARWVSDNTDYIGKNKVSKIKAVCDGEREKAYGFKWEYASVETIENTDK